MCYEIGAEKKVRVSRSHDNSGADYRCHEPFWLNWQSLRVVRHVKHPVALEGTTNNIYAKSATDVI